MNDERPIEKLLRRAAQERNDEAGAPPELHPVNRRLLQDEVARQFPPPPAASAAAAPTFWELLTQRWAYALTLVAVVGIAGLMLLPSLSKSKSKSSMELAKNRPAESVASPAVALEASATLQPSATVLSDADSVALRASGGGNNLGRNFEPTTITTPPPAALSLAPKDGEYGSTTAAKKPGADRASERLGYLETRRAESTDKPVAPDSYARNPVMIAPQAGRPTRSMDAAKAEAPTPTLATGAFVVTNDLAGVATDKELLARGGGAERQRTALNSQAFANLDATQAEAKRKDSRANQLTPPVLQNFQVQQQGRDLRVVDGDGSVYRGVVDEENTLYKQISERQQQKLAIANDSRFKFQTPKQTDAISPAKQLEAETYYLYRVEGTNRTLNQNVVFTWNFVDTNALVSGNLNYQNTAQKLDATKLPSQFPALLQNSYINGRAQFGEGREVEINAMPVK